MKTQTFLRFPLAFAALFATTAPKGAAQSVNLSFVTVGNPGNIADSSTGSLYGSVAYTYDIGKNDVTLTQYTAFLNAVAKTADPYGLYNSNLATDANVEGIAQAGSAGNYTYAVLGDGNRPVTYVSWFDAARFSNWLQNGQPVGPEGPATTETGAYTLNGDTSSGLETKNANATYWIPSENEWYKAAYYDPQLNGGAGGYYTYATQSNTAPGNVLGGGANEANYYNGTVYSVTQSGSYSGSQNYLTDVGAFTGSASYYGTFDQAGDVFNWNDAVISGSYRGLRGGSWYPTSYSLQSSDRDLDPPPGESLLIGFRVATVPEPSAAVTLMLGMGMLAFRRKRPF